MRASATLRPSLKGTNVIAWNPATGGQRILGTNGTNDMDQIREVSKGSTARIGSFIRAIRAIRGQIMKVGVTDGSLLRRLRVGYSTFRMVMTVIGLSLEFVRLYAIQMPALS